MFLSLEPDGASLYCCLVLLPFSPCFLRMMYFSKARRLGVTEIGDQKRVLFAIGVYNYHCENYEYHEDGIMTLMIALYVVLFAVLMCERMEILSCDMLRERIRESREQTHVFISCSGSVI